MPKEVKNIADLNEEEMESDKDIAESDESESEENDDL